MEERKSNLFSRFWPSSASRRSSTTQTAPTTTSTRTTESQPSSQTSPTSAPPTQAQTKSPARQSTAKARKGDRASPKLSKSPPREVQKTSQQSTTPPTDEPKTSSKPASPSRLSPQHRSPPQPSSPSHAAPKEPSKLHSPSRIPSRSPKQGEETLPASPSKGSTQREPSSIEKDSKPAASQQEPEMKEELKPDSPKVVNEAPSELEAKPEETKDVEANEETKKEVTYSAAPKSLSEIQPEKQEALDTKEILETPPNATASQPTDRNNNSDKSVLPNGKQVPLHENTKSNMSDFANKMAIRDPTKAISDRPVSVITLAGDNRGASMQMESDSSKREGPIHINRGYKINPADESRDGEERSSKGKELREERSVEDQLTEAYVNNNAQGINNSIVFNSSIVEGNPGVHLVFGHLPKEPIQSKDKTSFPETRKAEVNMSRSEKLTYQPTVRRRCLRGLLMETSESDPEKPRRHGCRVSCQKENNIDVL